MEDSCVIRSSDFAYQVNNQTNLKQNSSENIKNNPAVSNENTAAGNFAVSEKAAEAKESNTDYLNKLQQTHNMLETAQKGASEVNGHLNSINNILNKALESGEDANLTEEDINSINNSLKAVDNTVNNTVYNDKKLLDGSLSNKDANIKISDNETINLSDVLADLSTKNSGLNAEDLNLHQRHRIQEFSRKIQSAVQTSEQVVAATTEKIQFVDEKINEIFPAYEDPAENLIKGDNENKNIASSPEVIAYNLGENRSALQLREDIIRELGLNARNSINLQMVQMNRETVLALLSSTN